MVNQNRRRWTAEEKLAIIKEARQTPQAVSEVCRHHGIAPRQFYAWEKGSSEGVLDGLRSKQRERKQGNWEMQLEAEVNRLRAVAAELSAEDPSAGSGQALELKKGRWP